MKINLHSLFILIQIILISSVLAEDYQSHIPGSGEEMELSISESGEETLGAHIPGSFPDEASKKNSSPASYQIFGSGDREVPSVTWREKILGFSNQTPFLHENDPNLIRHTYRDLFQSIYNRGEKAFYISYIMDNYEITDKRGVFKKTFINGSNSKRGGGLHLGFDKYFYRGWTNLTYGMFFGLGYYNGKGIFSSGEISKKAKFIMWTIPIDFTLSFEIPVQKYANLQIGGGPSLMGLYQTRSDRNYREAKKHRRQLGRGYMGMGRFKISLANIFKKNIFNMFKEYNVTNCYFNLEARHQSYSNFQDDISISGTSFGAGFSFDYL